MKKEVDDPLMTAISSLDPVYVDGNLPEATMDLGANIGVIYFRLVPVKSENGTILYEKIPVLYLVRPKTALTCAVCPARFTRPSDIPIIGESENPNLAKLN